MSGASISVVIPTFDMAAHLPVLWDSLRRSGTLDAVSEVLFVNDGSTDDTAAVVGRLAAESAKVRLLDLGANRGRFVARLEGARAARGDRLLFLDSRLELPADFGERLARVADEHANVVGVVDIDVTRNSFCLYWDRSHRLLFWRHYRDTRAPLVLTLENYDRYLKGTTLFLCSRARWIEACETFAGEPPLNDDTYLMKEIVRREPIVVHPGLRAGWVPREDLSSFLARLWERGPSFVEYHVFAHRGPLFVAVMGGLAALAGWLVLLAAAPRAALAAALGAVLLVALSAAAMARGPGELLRLAPMQVAVVAVFGAGILRGLAVNLRRGCSRAGRP
jgi:glycosyltransferase involved in cell wall biosynthesis